ncbi:tRNA A37 threonylcarbamoyladenosine dehydratase [Ewingella americana]
MTAAYSDAYLQRFGGTARLYGQQALTLFSQAHVCVIGIGGVGSWAAEALARTGIGAITLIDMDDVCVTNTNRQIHALRENVGQAKTEVMAERILAINPECKVTCIDDFITPENVAEMLNRDFSYVIDAIDSVRPKAALLAYCRRYKIPVVTTGGGGRANRPNPNRGRRSGENHSRPAGGKTARALEERFWRGEKQQRQAGD